MGKTMQIRELARLMAASLLAVVFLTGLLTALCWLCGVQATSAGRLAVDDRNPDIRALCTSGRVCEVMGHQWAYNLSTWGWVRSVWDGEDLYVDRCEFTKRMCLICNETEKRVMGRWQ